MLGRLFNKSGSCHFIFNTSMFTPGAFVEGLLKINAAQQFTLTNLEISFESAESYHYYNVQGRQRTDFHDYPKHPCIVKDFQSRFVSKGLGEIRFEMQLPYQLSETFEFRKKSSSHYGTYIDAVLHTDKGPLYYYNDIEFNTPLADAFKLQRVNLTPKDGFKPVTVDISLAPATLRIGQVSQLTCDVKVPDQRSGLLEAKISVHQALESKKLLSFITKSDSQIDLGTVSLKENSVSTLVFKDTTKLFKSFNGQLTDNNITLVIEAYKPGMLFGESIETSVALPLKVGSALVAEPLVLSERYLNSSWVKGLARYIRRVKK